MFYPFPPNQFLSIIHEFTLQAREFFSGSSHFAQNRITASKKVSKPQQKPSTGIRSL
jgi:hypothetical protein